MKTYLTALCILFACVPGGLADEADWPTYGNGVQRQHSTRHQFADQLQPEWRMQFPEPRPIFRAEPQLWIDRAYEPVLAGDTVYLGLNSTDEVVALDLATGEVRWSFYAFGPVRRPPAHYEGRLYFGSDSGHVYCLDAKTGTVIWKFYAAYAQKYVLGNGRMISQWPVRSDVLVHEGRAYFGSGQWPFMGTYLYCLDAKTGKKIWCNEESSFFPSRHPHGGGGMSGLSAIGTIALLGDTLIVSNGRTRPMRFNAKNGERLRFESGWLHGSTSVVGADDKYFNGGYLFDLETCTLGYSVAEDRVIAAWQLRPVVEGGVAWSPGTKIRRWDLGSRPMPVVGYEEQLRYDYPHTQLKQHGSLQSEELAESTRTDHVWIKAGTRLVASEGRRLLVLDGADGHELWSHEAEAEIGSVIAGQHRLLVSTVDGRLTCFGEKGGNREIEYASRAALALPPAAKQRAARILATAAKNDGCVLVAGVTDGSLVKALAQEDFYRVVAFDNDAVKLTKLHGELADAGLYATRVDLVCGDIAGLPPYQMKLVCSEGDLSSFDAKAVFNTLRPYGGRACYEDPDAVAALQRTGLAGAKVEHSGKITVLSREGALEGSAWWTHDCGTPGHTLASEDTAIRGPLGVTWYGGPTAGDYFINRHNGAPRAQVVEGRVYCQKLDLLTCYDAYTGELLWQREVAGLAGVLKRRGHSFTPPAFAFLGGNMVTQPDAVYVETGDECLVLDPLTGETRKKFKLPGDAGWGSLQLLDDALVVLGDVLLNEELKDPADKSHSLTRNKYGFGKDPWNGAVNKNLFVLNRHSGKLLWQRPAQFSYRSSGIALGDGKVFILDFAPAPVLERFRGIKGSGDNGELLALDIKNGAEVWKQTRDATSGWLGYSRQADVLLETPDLTIHGDNRDMILHAWQGRDGTHLYEQKCAAGVGFKIIGDRFLSGIYARDIRTGEAVRDIYMRSFGRGCLSIAGPTMLTMRTSSSGYYDLTEQRSGLVALPGFRTSCFGSLVPADGLLNAPNEGSGCVCNYNVYTPLALTHMPDVDNWGASVVMASRDRFGLNFGAPGDRTSAEKTSFYQIPMTAWVERRGMGKIQEKSKAAKNRGILVDLVPATVETFEHPTATLAGEELPWIGASGVTGLEKLVFDVSPRFDMTVATLRFYFSEHETTAPGQRMFDVLIRDRIAIAGLDVFREAGGAKRMLVKEVRGVDLKDLTISFKPSADSQIKQSLLCGLEFIKEP